MKSLLILLGAVGFAFLAAPGHAQVKPETLVKQRQAVMTLHGKYWYRHLRPTGQGKIPYDANMVARNVGYMDALSQMPWDGFNPSTKDVPSGALPAVFADPAKFKEAQDRFRSEVVKLVAAVKPGDEASVKAQILAVNKGCDSCHESFREKK
ncbi:MAG: cytochrome c [Betaproteobacteria bacterium]|nr:cytochrome c [Betaproteobacteria bacterium]